MATWMPRSVTDAIRHGWIRRAGPSQLLLLWFGVLILAGTLLLMLPWAHRAGRVGLSEALFTATSATCVTGLIVVDTGTDFTPFGQGVILLLIQMGGLGIMTFAGMALQLLGMRLPLSGQAALEDTLFQRSAADEFRRSFWPIIRLTVLLEGAGALLLFALLRPGLGALSAAWSALFHAVSAFCNAGFSLYASSLIGWKEHPGALGTVMVLIVAGGLGHVVLLEIAQALRARRHGDRRPWSRLFTLHARVVLSLSAILLAGGALLLWLGGLAGAAAAPAPWDEALFQSVTARTAGFNTVEIGALPLFSLVVLMLLMFVGGSPASCAGGVKTTTLAIWLARLRGRLRGVEEVRFFRFRVERDVVRRALLLMSVSVLWNVVGVLILTATERGAGLETVLFEQISAFGTVGLSMGLTPHLSEAGRLWIVATMFAGRLGPLTLALGLARPEGAKIHFPEGRILIG